MSIAIWYLGCHVFQHVSLMLMNNKNLFKKGQTHGFMSWWSGNNIFIRVIITLFCRSFVWQYFEFLGFWVFVKNPWDFFLLILAQHININGFHPKEYTPSIQNVGLKAVQKAFEKLSFLWNSSMEKLSRHSL